MASEDVIVLGSSNDEAESEPKKKKPMPNAMFHIPSKSKSIDIKNFGNSIKTIQPESTIRPVKKVGASGLNRKVRPIASMKKAPEQPLTVEIDDEDVTEYDKTSSPQWYLRPEEQIEIDELEQKDVLYRVVRSMEEENNREPDTTRFDEITIENTPVKSVHPRHEDIGKELTITIEDSPIKPVSEIIKDVDSDIEFYEVSENKKSEGPLIKKKLDFPQKTRLIEEPQVVDIEINLKESNTIEKSEEKTKMDLAKDKSDADIKSSKPKTQVEDDNLLKKEVNTENIQSKDNITGVDNEFHPTYQKFISLCCQIDSTEYMKSIVEKRIKSYYKQCPKDYVESEEFIDMVSSKIASTKASPNNIYFFIQDIVDKLNLQRKSTKAGGTNKVDADNEPFDIKYDETQFDSKKRSQIRKLVKTIKNLHRTIQKLEEQEVESDDEDSVYLLTDKYKKKIVREHAKFCQLTNTKMKSEPRIHIKARTGRPTGPAKNLEKLINRKVSIGKPLPFPDFHDVLRCVRDANDEDKLGWNDTEIRKEARDLFTRCGKQLQRRRQKNEWRFAASRISLDVDQPEESSELKRKLDENKKEAVKKKTELFNKYVDRQNLLKLEAEEIGDIYNNSLENKHKRKQRLTRLVEEKSKKDKIKENDITKALEEKENKVETKDGGDLQEEKTKIKPLDVEYNNTEIVNEATSNDSKITVEKELKNLSVTEKKQNEIDDCDNKVESDTGESNLLLERYSETLNTFYTDTPIIVSDTLESDSEAGNVTKSCDIITIENSSYSETESTMDRLS